MIDKEVMDFEIGLAKIGMKFGAGVSLGVALFATGGTLFFSTLEHSYLLSPSAILFFAGMGIIGICVKWAHTSIDDLKKRS